jgi:hypothetical protein
MKPKKKRKPERTPQNKAMEAPENKAVSYQQSAVSKPPLRPPVRKS